MSSTTTQPTFNYVCANDMRAENPLNIRLGQMWKAVEEESGGRLHVEDRAGQAAGQRDRLSPRVGNAAVNPYSNRRDGGPSICLSR